MSHFFPVREAASKEFQPACLSPSGPRLPSAARAGGGGRGGGWRVRGGRGWWREGGEEKVLLRDSDQCARPQRGLQWRGCRRGCWSPSERFQERTSKQQWQWHLQQRDLHEAEACQEGTSRCWKPWKTAPSKAARRWEAVQEAGEQGVPGLGLLPTLPLLPSGRRWGGSRPDARLVLPLPAHHHQLLRQDEAGTSCKSSKSSGAGPEVCFLK